MEMGLKAIFSRILGYLGNFYRINVLIFKFRGRERYLRNS